MNSIYMENSRQNGMEIGACRFCGQSRPVSGHPAEGISADEKATRLCNCEESREYQEQLRKEQEREQALCAVQEWVQEQLGEQNQFTQLWEDVILQMAGHVYDESINKVTLNLDYTRTVSIKKTTNGNLKVEKKSKSSDSMEI